MHIYSKFNQLDILKNHQRTFLSCVKFKNSRLRLIQQESKINFSIRTKQNSQYFDKYLKIEVNNAPYNMPPICREGKKKARHFLNLYNWILQGRHAILQSQSPNFLWLFPDQFGTFSWLENKQISGQKLCVARNQALHG